MMDMGAPYNKHELVSFHTISKVCRKFALVIAMHVYSDSFPRGQ